MMLLMLPMMMAMAMAIEWRIIALILDFNENAISNDFPVHKSSCRWCHMGKRDRERENIIMHTHCQHKYTNKGNTLQRNSHSFWWVFPTFHCFLPRHTLSFGAFAPLFTIHVFCFTCFLFLLWVCACAIVIWIMIIIIKLKWRWWWWWRRL